MNLENTKIYTTDMKVIRKYARLVGKEFTEQLSQSRVGVFYESNNKRVYDFAENSAIDIDKEIAVMTEHQVNLMYSELFDCVESPEEREALDMIDTTSKRVESLAKGGVVEWKNGDSLEYIDGDGEWSGFLGRYISFDEYAGFHVIYASDGNIYHADSEQIRKSESPEQKAERERLEAAYDLYLKVQERDEGPGFAASFNQFQDGMMSTCRKDYLSIVDITGYRKESK